MVSCAGMLRTVLLRIWQHGILIAWLILISVVIWSTLSHYKSDPKHFYLREILGNGLLISRATASVVNVSCFMVIIPMSRSFTTYIRILGSKFSAKCVRRWIDASRKFHVICAFTILIAGCFHSVAHIINALNFSTYYNTVYKDINVAKFEGEDPLITVIGTVPGITGVLMIVILFILSAAAVQYVRDVNYDLFWFSHHLFLLFFILLLCHPMSGLLKEQINVLEHPPGCSMNISKNNNTEEDALICFDNPIFISFNSTTWKWVAAGLTVYTVDLGFRLFRRQNHVELLDFQAYNCDILYLKLLKEDFKAKPGQYIYLQCPKISLLEWHPFSISECPSSSDPSFSIHLRTKGDWSETLQGHITKEVLKIPKTNSECEANRETSPTPLNKRLLIDGPYSSCFEDVLRYSVSICIAGGIGFTPFASILNYLRIDIKSLNKIKRIHLFWICREVEIFPCFAKLLSDVFQIVWNANYPDKFEFYLYLTKEQSWNIIEEVLQDSFPFLRPRILFGRPQWNELFERWATIYKKTDVGLFCCGPEPLNYDIQKQSQKWNSQGYHFSYHHEAFS